MAERGRKPRSRRTGKGREDMDDVQDRTVAEEMSTRSRGGYGGDAPEGAMGGTSDAGTAADDAAEAAALGRGLPEDATQALPQTPGAPTGTDQGTRGFGGATPLEEPLALSLDQPPDYAAEGAGERREQRDMSAAEAWSRQAHMGRRGGDALPESGMGGTSDAGTAADDAADTASMRRGVSGDQTPQDRRE